MGADAGDNIRHIVRLLKLKCLKEGELIAKHLVNGAKATKSLVLSLSCIVLFEKPAHVSSI